MRKTIIAIFFFWTLAGYSQYKISTIAGGAPIPTPAPAKSSAIIVGGIATDRSGNVYFCSLNAVYKVDSGGSLTRVAGNERPGFSGDGGSALNAQLALPKGLALDSAGNLYIADYGNERVRRVSTGGVITTVAGTGIHGKGGDGGPATAALLAPYGLAVDSEGNLLISDLSAAVIRRVATDGTISTYAGGGTGGVNYAGPATNARFSVPKGIALDAQGNLYFADSSDNVIRKISGGNIATIAGQSPLTNGGSGDGGGAQKAKLTQPDGIAVDANGNVFITDNTTDSIRKISPSGIITSFAGGGSANPGDGGPATSANFLPYSVAVDRAGNVLLSDGVRVRKVTADGIINTVIGSGQAPSYGDGGLATGAYVSPGDVAVDVAGNVYFGDGNAVRKVTPGGSISAVAGTGIAGFSGDNGPATAAQLSNATCVEPDGNGNIYVCDFGNSRVRKISPSGIITTVAGNGMFSLFTDPRDGGQAVDAPVSPYALALDSSGNLWIADNYRIRKVLPSGIISTVAGTGMSGFLTDGGQALATAISPAGIALDGAGNIFFSDAGGGASRVRKISTSGVVTTVAGYALGSSAANPTVSGNAGDGGLATDALLLNPKGLAFDASGNLLIADSGNNRIRRVSKDGTITTIAGDGVPGYLGDGGFATVAELPSPAHIALGPSGNLYVAAGHSIRLLQPASAPATAVTNGASNMVGAISPGEIIVLYGPGLGPASLVGATLNDQGKFPTQLAGTQVFVNGVPSPIIYTASNQAAGIVPFGTPGGPAGVQVQYQGQTVLNQTVAVTGTSPAIFSADSSGKGPAAALNQDMSGNSAGHPAKPGSVIVLYATGEGLTSPASVDGALATSPYPAPINTTLVTIGGIRATLQYAGAAPFEVGGVMQINAVIPAAVTPGNAVPVTLTIGNVGSQGAITIAVSN